MGFKEEIHKAVADTGLPRAEICRQLGIPYPTFRHWYSCDQGEPSQHIQRWVLRDLREMVATE